MKKVKVTIQDENTEGISREDCIKCWKYKRDLPGSNKFEKSDLDLLHKQNAHGYIS